LASKQASPSGVCASKQTGKIRLCLFRKRVSGPEISGLIGRLQGLSAFRASHTEK
jgi:hypothetical protein